MQKVINRILLTVVVTLISVLAYKIVAPVPTIAVTAEQGEARKSTLSEVDSKEKVQGIIKDYLMQNPEIIVQAIDNLQKRKMQEAENKVSSYVNEKKQEIENSDSTPFFGNPKGDIVIVAFYDYKCGYCKKGNNNLNQLIASDPGVKVVLRPFPILGDASLYAAKIALSVYRLAPEKFKIVHEGLLQMQPISKESVEALLIANNIKLDAIEEELDKSDIKDMLGKNAEMAANLRIQGAPAYLINGNLLPGLVEVEQLKQLLIELRDKK